MKYTSYEDCIKFHGHVCGGVTMGYVLSCYAMDKINAQPGEMLYSVTEFQNCMTDAVQCVTGCTIGKRNLVIDNKDSHTMYLVRKSTGEGVKVSIHIVTPLGMPKRSMPEYILGLDPENICTWEPVKLDIV